MAIEVCRLGQISYEEAWNIQLEYLQRRIRGECSDTLMLVEHPHVITLGRKFPGAMDFLDRGVRAWQGLPLFVVERGGEATYHGPGQLVAYPIFRLPENFGPRAFLRLMETAIIESLRDFGLHGFTKESATGVWLKDAQGSERKIASLGIAARHFVTYHGLALNITTDLAQFQKISPCGFAPQVMTSMQVLMGAKTPSFAAVESLVADSLCRLFEKEAARAVSL